MSQNAYSAGGKFQPSLGNAKWSQVTSLANSNLRGEWRVAGWASASRGKEGNKRHGTRKGRKEMARVTACKVRRDDQLRKNSTLPKLKKQNTLSPKKHTPA